MYEPFGFPTAEELKHLISEQTRRAEQAFSSEQSIFRSAAVVFEPETVPPAISPELALALDDLTAFLPPPVVERRRIKVQFVDKGTLTPDEGLLK